MALPDIKGLGGAIAGFVAGVVMAIIGALFALGSSNDIWLEAKQIAAVVYGRAAVAEHSFVAGPVIVGTLIHFVVAIALGALFGILFRTVLRIPSTFGAPIVAGLIYSMLVWFVAYFIILPIVNPTLLDLYAPAFIFQHLAYGLTLGVVYMRLRSVPYNDDPSYAP
jgi:hypothetical protein